MGVRGLPAPLYVMKQCGCPSNPHVLRGSEQDLPGAALKRVDERHDGWAFLYECAVCGQLWHVDRWDKLQVSLCYKVDENSSWTKLGDQAMRIGYLTKARGGAGVEKCQWNGCENMSLKSLAFCAHHAYHEMGVRE